MFVEGPFTTKLVSSFKMEVVRVLVYGESSVASMACLINVNKLYKDVENRSNDRITPCKVLCSDGNKNEVWREIALIAGNPKKLNETTNELIRLIS